MTEMVSELLNNPADIFATDTHAAKHPEVYARRERTVSPESVAAGQRNAVINAARKRALRANTGRFRVKRTGQRGMFGFTSRGAA